MSYTAFAYRLPKQAAFRRLGRLESRPAGRIACPTEVSGLILDARLGPVSWLGAGSTVIMEARRL
jgi:hypothetical protein